ncbi:MAG: glutathione S-transferase N-terminal domain-containing protein [Candidatus Omnitrophota bacterium]|nr:glutathione S-transferase N-terminal domain-containing protein [Candidatus Omnitrophota bacterium]MDZ4242630.1 glutathione S-transferase N-terminal domain-containing protein [Candidatus Omnitrophota bacterium]
MPQLTLYHMTHCPYSRKVLNFLGQCKISVPLKNTGEKPEYREELRRIGGKTQVPCLVIDGKAMYESNDIIQWLKEHGKE